MQVVHSASERRDYLHVVPGPSSSRACAPSFERPKHGLEDRDQRHREQRRPEHLASREHNVGSGLRPLRVDNRDLLVSKVWYRYDLRNERVLKPSK